MRSRTFFFLKLFVYWMLFMAAIRISFLIYNYDQSATLTTIEILQALLYGTPMDVSMTGYLMALIGLLLTVSVFVKGKWLYNTVVVVSLTALFLQTVIVIVDVELYRHWGFRINNTPFFYMGSGAAGSIDAMMALKVLILGVIIFGAFAWLLMRKIVPPILLFESTRKKSAFILLAITASMFICIRGSFTVAPMNTGFVYFHPTKMYANHAAINVVWNFLKSLSSSSRINYPENFLDPLLTKNLFQELYPLSNDTTMRLHKAEKPNVILIIVESYTAGVLEVLGGKKGLTPRINALSKEGILFDQIYSTGDRTDKGLIGVLSAYPAQPNSSIIKYPNKTQTLPSLNKKMKALGYRTSFIYGGDADFANFRSYITTSGFEALTEDEDFDSDLNTSKWGVHDGFMLERALSEIDTAQAPFFKVVLTQSSHEPFDVPMKPLLPNTSDENKFLNSCHYTDSCIGAFIDKLKQFPEWKNTLVVLTADHGHRFPDNKELSTKERFHIPLLFFGGVIKKDSVIHTVGSQTDIANTLLAQVDKPSADFMFSKDLLNPTIQPHAIYFFNNGFGLVLPDKFLVYDNIAQQFIKEENVTEHDKQLGKAYQQTLYSDFNKR